MADFFCENGPSLKVKQNYPLLHNLISDYFDSLSLFLSLTHIHTKAFTIHSEALTKWVRGTVLDPAASPTAALRAFIFFSKLADASLACHDLSTSCTLTSALDSEGVRALDSSFRSLADYPQFRAFYLESEAFFLFSSSVDVVKRMERCVKIVRGRIDARRPIICPMEWMLQDIRAIGPAIQVDRNTKGRSFVVSKARLIYDVIRHYNTGLSYLRDFYLDLDRETLLSLCVGPLSSVSHIPYLLSLSSSNQSRRKAERAEVGYRNPFGAEAGEGAEAEKKEEHIASRAIGLVGLVADRILAPSTVTPAPAPPTPVHENYSFILEGMEEELTGGLGREGEVHYWGPSGQPLGLPDFKGIESETSLAPSLHARAAAPLFRKHSNTALPGIAPTQAPATDKTSFSATIRGSIRAPSPQKSRIVANFSADVSACEPNTQSLSSFSSDPSIASSQSRTLRPSSPSLSSNPNWSEWKVTRDQSPTQVTQWSSTSALLSPAEEKKAKPRVGGSHFEGRKSQILPALPSLLASDKGDFPPLSLSPRSPSSSSSSSASSLSSSPAASSPSPSPSSAAASLSSSLSATSSSLSSAIASPSQSLSTLNSPSSTAPSKSPLLHPSSASMSKSSVDRSRSPNRIRIADPSTRPRGEQKTAIRIVDPKAKSDAGSQSSETTVTLSRADSDQIQRVPSEGSSASGVTPIAGTSNTQGMGSMIRAASPKSGMRVRQSLREVERKKEEK